MLKIRWGEKMGAQMSFDVAKLRDEFQILSRQVDGKSLCYLDSANTSHKPQGVIDAINNHYRQHNANVARAMHTLGAEATDAYEGARAKIANFIGANSASEIVFTKNASEALNLAAHTLGAKLTPGDEIVISVMEHHSNIVGWQLLCERSGAVLRWFDITEDGQLDLEAAKADNLINERTKIVSLAWVSNVLGTINPISELAAWVHSVGAIFVVDASQGVPHLPTDVQTLGADLLAFTGHKMCGPTGIGVLWGRYELLAALPPFLGGGEMIEVVKLTGSTYAPPPYRFEAGTPPIAQVVGLGAAVDFLDQVGMAQIAAYEHDLTSYALERLRQVAGLKILGRQVCEARSGAISFTLATTNGLDIHPHDLMTLLDTRQIAVRGGHHCARPLHERLGIQASTRASLYLYNEVAEIDRLVAGLDYVRNFFERV